MGYYKRQAYERALGRRIPEAAGATGGEAPAASQLGPTEHHDQLFFEETFTDAERRKQNADGATAGPVPGQ